MRKSFGGNGTIDISARQNYFWRTQLSATLMQQGITFSKVTITFVVECAECAQNQQ